MTRTVHCRKYQRELEGLAMPPLPGAKGQDIYNNISKQAWQEWLQHQTMLINEKKLNLMDMTARTYLSDQMDKFFRGENYDNADGYVPPASQDE
ncbi:Fe-S cluster biosynthesis and repair protein YggX [Alteromonadaceae bacterium 2753L.S.0a.02]|nr:Fe-S cluster biosynthesis and repair protein YggX [Alteromonadaceae bacterium 2753L.S.0a.02]